MVAADRDTLKAEARESVAVSPRLRKSERRRRTFTWRRPSMSGLTVRILAINLVSIAILFVGVLYLDKYQNALIRGELDALTRQAEVIARAVG